MIDYTRFKLIVGKLYKTKRNWYLNKDLESYSRILIEDGAVFFVLEFIGERLEGNYTKYNVYKVLYNNDVYFACLIPPAQKQF